MMNLIVEDGTIVAGANSYTDLANARIVAERYGVTLPVTTSDANSALITGGMWIKQQEPQLQGGRLSASQTVSYPRTPVKLHGFVLTSDQIPKELIDAQVLAAAEQGVNGGVLSFTTSTANVKREKLEGVGEKEYYENGKSIQLSPTMISAHKVLYPLTNAALNVGGGHCLVRGC